MSDYVGMNSQASRANFYPTATRSASRTQDAVQTEEPSKQLNSPNTPGVIVSLSPQAQAVLDAQAAQKAGVQTASEAPGQAQAEQGASHMAKLV